MVLLFDKIFVRCVCVIDVCVCVCSSVREDRRACVIYIDDFKEKNDGFLSLSLSLWELAASSCSVVSSTKKIKTFRIRIQGFS